MATQLLFVGGLLAWLLTHPDAYRHSRSLVLTTVRLLMFVPRSSRSLEGAPCALKRPATPGLAGYVTDAARLLLGTRVLAVVASGVLVPLPLALQLLSQCASAWMSVGAYSSTQVGVHGGG